MEKSNLSSEQEPQTVEIVQTFSVQDFVLTQTIEIHRKEAPRKIAQAAMSSPTSTPSSRSDYTPRNRLGISDNFSHDFDAEWYQGRI